MITAIVGIWWAILAAVIACAGWAGWETYKVVTEAGSDGIGGALVGTLISVLLILFATLINLPFRRLRLNGAS